MKKLFAAILVITLSISSVGCSTSNETTDVKRTEDVYTSVTVAPDEISQTKTTELEIQYHNNVVINKLITQYNGLTDSPISSEMILEGAYDFRAIISCNGVSIIIDATENNGVFIDYEDENTNDESIKLLFRDFCKVMNEQITDEDVDNVWNILRAEKPMYYNPYDFNGIKCAYYTTNLNNGRTRFNLKTNYMDYH